MAPRPLQIAGWTLLTALLLTAALSITGPGLRGAANSDSSLASATPHTAPRNPAQPRVAQSPATGRLPPTPANANGPQSASLTAIPLPPSGAATPLPPSFFEDPSPFPAPGLAPVLDDAPARRDLTLLPASRYAATRHTPRSNHIGFEELPPPPSAEAAPSIASPAPAPAAPFDAATPLRELVTELSLLRQDLNRVGPGQTPTADVRSEVQSLRSELSAIAEQRRLDSLHEDVRRLTDRQESLEQQFRTPAVAQVPEPEPVPQPTPEPFPEPSQPEPAATEPVQPAPTPIEIQPAAGPPGRYTVHLVKAEPAQVIRRISELSGGNLVLSSEVRGQLTLSLPAAEPEELLHSVAAALDCVVIEDGPARLIVPATQAATRRAAAQQTVARLFRPAYIAAEDLLPLVPPMLTPGLGEAAITPTGAAAGESPSRAQGDALLVVDLPHVVAQVEAMLAEVDVAPEQFVIEAVIATVTWNQRTAGGVVAALQDEGVCAAPQRRDRQTGRGRSGQVAQYRGRPRELLAHLGQMAELNIEATPTIHVLNRQQADIEVGSNVAYRERVAFGRRLRLREEQIEFLPVRTQLSVRPFMQGNDAVRLQVHPRVTHVHPDPASKLPREEIAELSTDITIPLGCTAIIGGLTRHNGEVSPALSPMERWFGRKRKPATPGLFSHDETTEVVILLTPRRADDMTASFPLSGDNAGTRPAAFPYASEEPAPLKLPPSPSAPLATESVPDSQIAPAFPDLSRFYSSQSSSTGPLTRSGNLPRPRKGSMRSPGREPASFASVPSPVTDLPQRPLVAPYEVRASEPGDWRLPGTSPTSETPAPVLTDVTPIPVDYARFEPHEPALAPTSIMVVSFIPPEPTLLRVAAPQRVTPPRSNAVAPYIPPEPAPPLPHTGSTGRSAPARQRAPSHGQMRTPVTPPTLRPVPPVQTVPATRQSVPVRTHASGQDPTPAVTPAAFDLSQVPPPPPDPEFEPEPAAVPAPYIPPYPSGRPRRIQRDRHEHSRRVVQRRHMQRQQVLSAESLQQHPVQDQSRRR